MTRLTASQVDQRLKPLKGWHRKGEFITKTFKFRRFMAGIGFVDDIAAIAERLGHHPDIHIVWTTVELEVQTHDEGGITPLDLKLATEIEKHLASQKAQSG